MKTDTRVRKFTRKHLGGQRVTLTIETGLHPLTITIRAREIVGQSDRRRLRWRDLHRSWRELYRKRARLKSSETRHHFALYDRSVSNRPFLAINFTRRNHRRYKP